jgi:hypothetical protein
MTNNNNSRVANESFISVRTNAKDNSCFEQDGENLEVLI